MALSGLLTGIGGVGNDIAGGQQINADQRRSQLEDQLRKFQLRMQFGEFQQKMKEAALPKMHGTFQTPDGSVYAITTDPATGQPSTKQVYKSSSKYPEFRTLPEMEAWAVEHGDKELLVQAQGAIKATQRPENPTPYADWRKQNPSAPVGDYLKLSRRPRADTGEAPEGRIKALANKWANEGIKPPSKYQAAVEEYMEDHGTKAKIKLNPAEQRLSDLTKQIEPKIGQLKDVIEKAKLQNDNDWVFGDHSALMNHLKFSGYKFGHQPEKVSADLIRTAAALQVMGAAPWMQIGRGKYMFETIVNHLPKPTDTPAQLYQKALFLQGIVDEAKQSLPDHGGQTEEPNLDQALDKLFPVKK